MTKQWNFLDKNYLNNRKTILLSIAKGWKWNGKQENGTKEPEGRDDWVASDRVFRNLNTKMSLPQMCAYKANQLYDLYILLRYRERNDRERGSRIVGNFNYGKSQNNSNPVSIICVLKICPPWNIHTQWNTQCTMNTFPNLICLEISSFDFQSQFSILVIWCSTHVCVRFGSKISFYPVQSPACVRLIRHLCGVAQYNNDDNNTL